VILITGFPIEEETGKQAVLGHSSNLQLPDGRKMVNLISENYHILREEVRRTAEKCGRSPDGIKVVLVTKYQPVERINAAIEAGADQLAENYPELLIPKLPLITNASRIKWHMIGHIQSRKTDLVMDHFDYVHSVHSLKIAQRMQNRGEEKKHILPILLEVNLSGEESKNGYRVAAPQEYETFLTNIREISVMSHLELRGLMVMPPFTESSEDSRKYFSDLRLLLDKVNSEIPGLDLIELSMGTSQDYQVAIEEGATLLRIGTLVFGERK
jgi:hypothetical protein